MVTGVQTCALPIFVWFPGADGEPDSVKDIRSGKQVEADATTWQPPGDDAAPRVTGRGGAVDTGADTDAGTGADSTS